MNRIPFFYNVLIACSICFVTAHAAFATPVSFHEEFLGGCQAYYLEEKDKAVFSFDLTQTGGTSILRNSLGGIKSTSIMPTTDETNFSIGDTILDATLRFVFCSIDPPTETIKIKTDILDGKKLLHKKIYDLSLNIFDLDHRSLELELDLRELNVLDYLQRDGQFITFAIAPFTESSTCNDFFITSASLSGTYEPVPEPASIFLFGAGLTFAGSIIRKTKHKHQKTI